MPTDVPPPVALLAELTHRCPLACPYCSNPMELMGREQELTATSWARVFTEAAALGVLQVHLSGGEPAARRDLVEIVTAAHQTGLYTNLITSGLGLSEKRLKALEQAGLDHIQLSIQGPEASIADKMGGAPGAFAKKAAVADIIAQLGFPLTLNAVMHRFNLEQLEATIALAERWGARRLEIACVQFQGWALKNQAALIPTAAQIARTIETVATAREKLRGILAIDFVPPDYYADYPKACMGGWGSTGLNITPDGTALPCHAAQSLPGLDFPNIQDTTLSTIWYDNPAFNRFRGIDWMAQPCKGCERQGLDFGGCRCQAYRLTGDMTATDPVCIKSPQRASVDALLRIDNAPLDTDELVFRRFG